MKIDRNMIEHLEALARIELSGDEREKLAAQLDRIVRFVEKLEELDTTGIIDKRALRGVRPPAPDAPESWPGRENALEQAPDSRNGFYRVPPVIDRGEDS